MEYFYWVTLHFFPKYCNIKEQFYLNCTLIAHRERSKVCDSLSQHSDRVKYGAFCSHLAVTKDNYVRKDLRPHTIVKYMTYVKSFSHFVIRGPKTLWKLVYSNFFTKYASRKLCCVWLRSVEATRFTKLSQQI